MPTGIRKEVRLAKAALDSKDYRGFLANALVATTREGTKPNVAALSRKAGFSSRSFIGDVIEGRRRLSASSYPKLVRALGLPTKVRTYFHLLVVREEAELNFEGWREEQIEAKLADARSKLLAALRTAEVQQEDVSVMFKGRDIFDCYAALGERESGSTLEDVVRKTGLPQEICQQTLSHLAKLKVVTLNEGRYFASNPIFFFKDLGEDHGMKNCYLQTLDELKRKANAGFNAKDRAFYHCVYSVDRSRLPELKQKLSEVMQEFVEATEDAKGDAIAKLALGFYV